MPEIDLDSLKRLKAVAEKVPLQRGPRAEDARRCLLDWIGNLDGRMGFRLTIRPRETSKGNDVAPQRIRIGDTVRCVDTGETLVVRAFYGTGSIIAICQADRGGRVKIEIGRLVRVG